jgi:hypothetical protein
MAGGPGKTVRATDTRLAYKSGLVDSFDLAASSQTGANELHRDV